MWSRNVLAKVPKKLKKVVADDMRSIFYASSKPKAMEFFDIFRERWQQDLPSAVKCLENSIEACLTFFICPEEEWISLRTTNIIVHLNNEYKGRTKPINIVTGENACYTIMAFICLKMELHWKSTPSGKARVRTCHSSKNWRKRTLHKKVDSCLNGGVLGGISS